MDTFTQEEATAIRKFASSLPDEQRSAFIDKFKSLSDEGQRTLISRLPKITTISTQVPQNKASQYVPPAKEHWGLFGSVPESAYQLGERNILGAITDRPEAAIRSAILGKGYTAGAINPTNVPKFQDLAIQASQQFTSPRINAAVGLIPSAVGLGADIITSPANALMATIGMSPTVRSLSTLAPAQAFARFMSKQRISPIQYAREAIYGTKPAKEAARASKQLIDAGIQAERMAVEQSGSRQLLARRTLTEKQLAELNEESRGIKIALDRAEEKNLGKVSKEAYAESSKLRKDLPTVFAKKSQEYGAAKDAILKDAKIPITSNDIAAPLERNLINHGILRRTESGIELTRSPMTSDEVQIYQAWKKSVDNPDVIIDIADLIRSSRSIRPKYGKQWTPSEHLKASVSEDLSDIVKDKVPGFAELQAKYAPYLQWKREAINVFKPFAGEFKSKSGATFISKLGDANKVLTSDERAFLNTTEIYLNKSVAPQMAQYRNIGKEINMRRLSQPDIKAQKQLNIKESSRALQADIDSSIRTKVSQMENLADIKKADIDSATEELINSYKRRRWILGTGLAVLATSPQFKKYVLNRITYSLFGGVPH